MTGGSVHILHPPRTRPVQPSEILDHIIISALRLGASDIHLGANHTAQNDPYLLRFRVHGKLQPARTDLLQNVYREVTSRIKILAGLDITETQAPQDGQIQIQLEPEGAFYLLRVSTVPGPEFEDVVMRVQNQTQSVTKLDQILMPMRLREKLGQLIQQKSGLIVLNGPAGSGKTTTIYALLSTLASPERKIITAEDPIESRLPFVSHTQVSARTNFAALCRAFMRQDADVIFVGEVRDPESAEACIQLAQTGHLVLTSMHTRDAIGVVARLCALDVQPNMVAAALLASLAQRLVPRICTHCRQEAPIPAELGERMHRILPMPAQARIFQRGPGCPKCSLGIVGRIPIFELMLTDSEVGDLINRNASRTEMARAARARGMITLAQDALSRLYGGYTDLSSIFPYVFHPDEAPVSINPVGSPAAAPPAHPTPPAAPVAPAPPSPDVNPEVAEGSRLFRKTGS
jgi:type IV pilus assembly protein PilB